MINANSPICVREKPDSIAMRSDCPVISIPKVPNRIMPAITTPESSNIGQKYSTMTLRSTIMPTDMKNTAPNRSLTGLTTASIDSA